MSEYANKALVYAASVFTIMTVVTLLITYYNSARKVADTANNRVDIATTIADLENSKENFTEIITTGVDVRSLIRKYAGNENVEIDVDKMVGLTNIKYGNVNNNWLNENIAIIDEKKMSVISPAMMARITKKNEDGVVKFYVHLLTELAELAE